VYYQPVLDLFLEDIAVLLIILHIISPYYTLYHRLRTLYDSLQAKMNRLINGRSRRLVGT